MKGERVTERESLVRSVYRHPRLVASLKFLSDFSVFYSAVLFLFLAHKTFTVGIVCGVVAVSLCGVAFALVSLVRALINAPRPYELYSFFDKPPKDKKGHSFPGRHAFSIFCIATASLPVMPILGSVALLLGVALSVSRVLLGIHFIRDVVAGGMIGVIAGVLAAFAAGLF